MKDFIAYTSSLHFSSSSFAVCFPHWSGLVDLTVARKPKDCTSHMSVLAKFLKLDVFLDANHSALCVLGGFCVAPAQMLFIWYQHGYFSCGTPALSAFYTTRNHLFDQPNPIPFWPCEQVAKYSGTIYLLMTQCLTWLLHLETKIVICPVGFCTFFVFSVSLTTFQLPCDSDSNKKN